MCILLFSASIYVVKSFFLLRHSYNDLPVSFDLHGCLIIFSRLHRTTYFAAYHPYYIFMQTTMDILVQDWNHQISQRRKHTLLITKPKKKFCKKLSHFSLTFFHVIFLKLVVFVVVGCFENFGKFRNDWVIYNDKILQIMPSNSFWRGNLNLCEFRSEFSMPEKDQESTI